MGFKVKSKNPGDVLPPNVPPNVLATVIGQGQVSLTWDASTDVSGVREYRANILGGETYQILAGEPRQHVWTSLPVGTHQFQVVAIDNQGNYSAPAIALATITAGASLDWNFTQSVGQSVNLGAMVVGTPITDSLLPYSTIPVGQTPQYTVTVQKRNGLAGAYGITCGINSGDLIWPNTLTEGAYEATVDLIRQPVVAGEFEPAITNEPQADPYRTIDDTTNTLIGGMNYEAFNLRLHQFWQNKEVGDYTGNNAGVDQAQGGSPFHTHNIVGIGYKAMSVYNLVQRALTTGKNKGFYLWLKGTGATINWAGRLSANPPILNVTNSDGTVFSCPCILSTHISTKAASQVPYNTASTTFRTSASYRGFVQFDLSGVTGTVTQAQMQLFASTTAGTAPVLELYETRPPEFILGCGNLEPVLGLAAEVGENNLATAQGVPLHPDVYSAGHFEGSLLKTNSLGTPYVEIPRLGIPFAARDADLPIQIIPDPDAPGTSYLRGEIQPITIPNYNYNRHPLQMFKTLMRPNLNDPDFSIDTSTLVEEVYARIYFMRETGWDDMQEGVKIGLCFDLRFGHWVPTSFGVDPELGGHWEADGGNSNNVSDGRKHRGIACHQHLAWTDYRHNEDFGTQWYYKGSTNWQQFGYSGRPTDPNWDIRPFHGYNYHSRMYNGGYQDEGYSHPRFQNLVNIKTKNGRWYCLEQYIKLNTLTATKDLGIDGSDYGNYVPNRDGILKTWVNGILCDERSVDKPADKDPATLGHSGFDWRGHPDMGIQAVGFDCYVGGQSIMLDTMNFRINHFVAAKRYIGPRVKP